MAYPVIDKPLAAPGLASYRCRSRMGWIMIGATDDVDALREARRSYDNAQACDLQAWNGREYVYVEDSALADSHPKDSALKGRR